MAAQNWTIKIVPGEDLTAPASFVPDVYTPSGAPPDSLQAQVQDEVSWNNRTGQDHRLVVTDAAFVPRSPETVIAVAPRDEPSKAYVPQSADATATTDVPPKNIIYYACSIHTLEHGSITIVT